MRLKEHNKGVKWSQVERGEVDNSEKEQNKWKYDKDEKVKRNK